MNYIVAVTAHHSYTTPPSSTKKFIVPEAKLHDFLMSFIENFKQDPDDLSDMEARFGKDIELFFEENKLLYTSRDCHYEWNEYVAKNTDELMTYLTHKNTDFLIEFIQEYCMTTMYTDVLNELEIGYIVEMGRNILFGAELFIEYVDQEINEDLIRDG